MKVMKINLGMLHKCDGCLSKIGFNETTFILSDIPGIGSIHLCNACVKKIKEI